MDVNSELNTDLAIIIGEKSPQEAVRKYVCGYPFYKSHRFKELLLRLQGKPAECIIDAVSKISNASK